MEGLSFPVQKVEGQLHSDIIIFCDQADGQLVILLSSPSVTTSSPSGQTRAEATV